jgi:hypothetical protein
VQGYEVQVSRSERWVWDKDVLEDLFKEQPLPEHVKRTLSVDKRKFKKLPMVEQEQLRDALTRKLDAAKNKGDALMTFKVMKTSNVSKETTTKVMLYAHHGFGKTYQCRFYQRRFGPGLILSGEAGLKSIEDVDIDYLPFSSWDGKNDAQSGVYSFRGICKLLTSAEFSICWIQVGWS